MKYFLTAALMSLTLCPYAFSAGSGELEKARSQVSFVYQRLTGGLKPAHTDLNTWTAKFMASPDKKAALLAVAEEAIKIDAFYSVTVLNFAQQESNKDRALSDDPGALSDLTATIVGMVRDEKDYRSILYDDIVYIPDGATYSSGNNKAYDALATAVKNGSASLSDSLKETTQTAVTGLPLQAGIFTLRGFGSTFYEAGTSRGPVRFSFINYICRDMEKLSDINVNSNSIRRDVDRAPGGDAANFVNECRGCHFALDPIAGAFANIDFIPPSKPLDDAAIKISTLPTDKTNRNNTVFPEGMKVVDDSWVNNWFASEVYKGLWDGTKPKGKGIKEFGEMIASTKMFPDCMAERVFHNVCLGDAVKAGERLTIEGLSAGFVKSGYNMKSLMKNAAVECGSQIGL